MKQQCFGSHTVVAVAIIGRDVALVAPKNVGMVPINATAEGVRGQQFIHAARGGSAGKRYPEMAAPADRFRRQLDEQFRCGASEYT